MAEIEINYFHNLQDEFYKQTGKSALVNLNEYLLWLNYYMYSSISNEIYSLKRDVQELKNQIKQNKL